MKIYRPEKIFDSSALNKFIEKERKQKVNSKAMSTMTRLFKKMVKPKGTDNE